MAPAGTGMAQIISTGVACWMHEWLVMVGHVACWMHVWLVMVGHVACWMHGWLVMVGHVACWLDACVNHGGLLGHDDA